jgi:FKBP-type peptidyl-prolyl cis-trans isomerase FkpA
MSLNQSPKTVREQRQAAQSARRRNLWLIIGAIILIGAGAALFFAFGNRPTADQPSADPTPENPALPVVGVGTFSTASGLQYQDLKLGSGPAAAAGDTVSVHYTGWLVDGTQFDSSVGGEPFEFTLGRGSVIEGWDQGVEGMQGGGVRKLFIPAELGYGESGVGEIIPPNATLVFEVELLEIK